MKSINLVLFLAVLSFANIGHADVSQEEVSKAVEGTSLSTNLGMSLSSMKEVASDENYVKYWAVLEGQDCFNTTELVYDKKNKSLVVPNNGYALSNPVQSNGVTPCDGGNQ